MGIRCMHFIEKITIPKSVTVITLSCFTAFRKCTSLKSISLPDSIVSLGEGVFSKCSEFSEINIQSKIKIYKKTYVSLNILHLKI